MQKTHAIAVLILCLLLTQEVFAEEVWTADIPINKINAKEHERYATNVYMLFVWGTSDENIAWATKISQRKILTNLYETVRDSSGCNFVCKSLEGKDAHPEKILAACEEFSQNAGKDDAVFVYMLCHGGQTSDRWAERYSGNKQRVHFLSPIATKASDLQANEIGLRRASIMLKLKENPHRLDMLITDSCSGKVQMPMTPRVVPRGAKMWKITKLIKILKEEKGTVNINSTDPDYERGEGQLALGWLPLFQNEKGGSITDEEYFTTSVKDPYAGTVFCNVFAKILTEKCEGKYTVDDFCEELKKRLDGEFQEITKHLDAQGDKSVQIFIRQGTQTLSKFNRFGQAEHWNFDMNTGW